MSGRQRLRAWRPDQTFEFQLEGVSYVAGVGHFPGGMVSEIFFYGPGKSGSSVKRFAHDAAGLAFLALQHGATVDRVRHSPVKPRDGSGARPVSKLLGLVAHAAGDAGQSTGGK